VFEIAPAAMIIIARNASFKSFFLLAPTIDFLVVLVITA
jgi:hypothetical protein